MYKIRTTINDKEVAHKLGMSLVESHAAVSVRIREIDHIYAWNGEVQTEIEYEVEALTRSVGDAYDLIHKEHPSALPEFTTEDVSGSNNIEKWCSDWCKNK